MKIKAVDYAMYNVSDLKKSMEFYQKTLGLKLAASGDGWAEFIISGFALVLGSWGFDPKATANGSTIALAVDDVKKTLDELKKKGVKIDEETWDTPVCIGGAFYDPDGNKFCLHTRKDGTCG